MTLKDAKNLNIGEKVKSKNGIELEVCGLHEHMPWCGGSAIIYVRGKTENGDMMKFNHKELIKGWFDGGIENGKMGFMGLC